MIDAVLFFGIFLCFMLFCMCLMIGKFIFDFNQDKKQKPDSVYMLKVMPDGTLKIKRYRGKVQYWSEME